MKNSITKTMQTFILAAAVTLMCSCGHEHGPDTHTHDGEEAHTHAPGDRGDGHSHYDEDAKVPAFTYLRMNGEFHLNPGDTMSQDDERNPGRLSLTTSEEKGSLTKMTFYDHYDLNKKLAECGYEYIGSRPDPHYFPKESKTSIWDIFKKVKDFEGDCINYEYVISRSPHGEPLHMHLRYGKDLEALLAMSNDKEDGGFNPWWATYCEYDMKTACD